MKTILIVEDNEDLRDLLGFLLRRDGYHVQEASNGKEALDQLCRMHAPPSLLLLDLMMPVMSGSELLQVLAEENRLDSLPVVVLSAGGEPYHVRGSQRFMRKPVEPRIILALVHEICGHP